MAFSESRVIPRIAHQKNMEVLDMSEFANRMKEWTAQFKGYIGKIKDSGFKTLPWKQPWMTAEPANYSTGHVYTGWNSLNLKAVGGESDYATERQIGQAGCYVPDDLTGYPIGFVKYHNQFTEEERKDRESKGFTGPVRINSTVYPISGVRRLINDELLDNIESREPQHLKAEEIVKKLGIKLKIGKPMYNPVEDQIYMPARSKYKDLNLFFVDLSHEVGHYLGHETRAHNLEKINRIKPDYKAVYSREELTAQLFSKLFRDLCGIETDDNDNNEIAYCKGWYEELSKDPSLLMWAGDDAQKRANWLVQQLVA